MSTTYISGEIDLTKVSKEKRLEIKTTLQSFYGVKHVEEIYMEDYLSFEEEWFTHEDTDNFLKLLLRIIPFLDPANVVRLSCEGDTHSDYWSIIIKRGKLYIQRYILKPIGDKKEFIYSPNIVK